MDDTLVKIVGCLLLTGGVSPEHADGGGVSAPVRDHRQQLRLYSPPSETDTISQASA